ncbi:MAG: DUF2946 domain-containing protein [Burkholderiaceae bacterium]
MNGMRAHGRIANWIVIVAMLLASLAPALSQAVGVADHHSWVEVCTPQGSTWVRADAGDAGGAPSAAHLIDHCPYCSIHLPALALPPPPAAVAPACNARDALPQAFLQAPRTLHAWSPAHPRAPPLRA